MVIRLPINTKSLYLNIKNDNKIGHSATVATPIKQGAAYNPDLIRIKNLPENINSVSREALIEKILSKSRAEARISNVYVFNKISVNGKTLENVPAFCMYIREETGEDNVHYGRQKLHYPITFKFCDNETEINNNEVIKAVSEALNNYAFIVDAFEYDTETRCLNFDALIVGYNSIPYSKVFINQKGVGKKFTTVFYENVDLYDTEIIALREKFGYDNICPENFEFVMAENRTTAVGCAVDWLTEIGAKKIRNMNEEYPYSLYDLEYELNGIKQYLIVRFTATKMRYFSLPFNKTKFCNDFCENVKVYLVYDINGFKTEIVYTADKLIAMGKSISSLLYTDTEENNG